MARISTSSSGGVVSIQDTDGNPITATNGAINVNVQTEKGFDTLTPGMPAQMTVGTTSLELIAANPNRKYAHVINYSSDPIFIQFQVSASLNRGIKLTPGSFYTIETTNLWLGSINAIGVASNQSVEILEGE